MGRGMATSRCLHVYSLRGLLETSNGTRLKSFPKTPAALGDDEIGHSQTVSELMQWQKDEVGKHAIRRTNEAREKNVLWYFSVSVRRKRRWEAGHKTVTLHLQCSSCLVPARLLEH